MIRKWTACYVVYLKPQWPTPPEGGTLQSWGETSSSQSLDFEVLKKQWPLHLGLLKWKYGSAYSPTIDWKVQEWKPQATGKNQRESVNQVHSMCATATAEVTSSKDTQTHRQSSPSEKESRATTQSLRRNFQGCSSCYAHLHTLLQKAFPYHRCHSSLPAMQRSSATFRQDTQ